MKASTHFADEYARFKDDIEHSAGKQFIPGMERGEIVTEMLVCLWKASNTWRPSKGPFANYWWSVWLNRKYDLTKMHDRHHGRTEYTDDHALLEALCGPSSDRVGPAAPDGADAHERAVWNLLASGEQVNQAIQLAGISKRRYYQIIDRWKHDESVHASLLA